jgi:mRNA deadenylase 3'-5' endonuclease subunit Ccr4
VSPCFSDKDVVVWCRFNNYCPPQYLKWTYRLNRILQELEQCQADVLCLQEVEEPVFYEQLTPWMQEHGYSSLFHPKK